MQIVYATGQPRFFEFAVTAAPESVPADATLFATCSGESVTENLDEDLFDAMTDEEFYEFRGMVGEASARETRRLAAARLAPAGRARRLWQSLLVLTLFVLAGHAPAFGQTEMINAAHGLSPEQQVRRAEATLWRAYSVHDTAAIERLLADDLSFTRQNGAVSGKAAEMRSQRELRQGWGDQLSELSNSYVGDPAYQVERVRLYGHIAVTTSIFAECDTSGGAVRFHFTNTWIRRGDAWQVVAIQIMPVSGAVSRDLDTMARR